MLGLAETVAPTDLKDTQLEPPQRLATAAYRALRVEGLARIDVFLARDDEIVINEVNTMPGFTPISMFPMLWEAEGLPFGGVVEELVLLARARRRPAAFAAHTPGALRTRARTRHRSGPPARRRSGPGRPRSLAAPCPFPMGHGAPRSATIGAGPAGAARTPSVPCGVWS